MSRASHVRDTRDMFDAYHIGNRKLGQRLETMAEVHMSLIRRWKFERPRENPLMPVKTNTCRADRCMCNADNMASSAVGSYIRGFAAGHVFTYWKILNGCVLSDAFVGPFLNARLFSFVRRKLLHDRDLKSEMKIKTWDKNRTKYYK